LKKVIVTGGSGLVGRYVVDELAQTHDLVLWDLKNSHRSDLPFKKIDLLDERAVRAEMQQVDAIVHLAGIPHPLNDPAERVFRVNTQTTYNLLEAAAAIGVPKFVFMSSESTLGFAFCTTRMWPLAVPIDETHPLRPQDPYGLSKIASESACEGISRRVGMRTVCLRAPWVWVPEVQEIAFYIKLVAEYENWFKNCWAFIHVKDVAQAILRAVEKDLPTLHERMFICADVNWTGRESRDLLKRFYPETENINTAWTGAASFISNRKAKELLGFVPTGTVSEILNAKQ
jgi:UDP-glucose 4-epimerase